MSLAGRFRRTFVPLRRVDPRIGRALFQRESGRPGSSDAERDGGEVPSFAMVGFEPHALWIGG